MDCSWYRTRIPAFLDGELSVRDVAPLAEHLRTCASCCAYLDSERAMVNRLRETAAGERAPEFLLARVQSALRGASAADPAPATASRGHYGWALTALAAAILMVVAAPWSFAGPGLVRALAAEHQTRTRGGRHAELSVSSKSTSKLELYLTEQLGIPVKLPGKEIPAKRGACCTRRGGRTVGLVACFCSRRRAPVTLFVVPAQGLDLDGLEPFTAAGNRFLRGSSAGCHAVLWIVDGTCYALVAGIAPEDLAGMAIKASVALRHQTAPGND